MQTQFNGNLINVVAPTFEQQVNGDTHSLFNESVLNEVQVASANPSFNILQNNPPLMINPNNFNRLDDLDLLFQMDDEFFQKNDMSFDVDPCSSDAYLLSKSGVSRDALTFWINEGAFDDEIESAKMMSYKEQEERVALSTTDSSSILIRANIALNIFKKNPDHKYYLIEGVQLLEALDEVNTIIKQFQPIADKQRPNVQSIDLQGQTLLARAAAEGKIEAIKLLDYLGVDKNQVNNSGQTPIFLAAKNNKLESICILQQLGADFLSADFEGTTPLEVAQAHRFGKVTNQLEIFKSDPIDIPKVSSRRDSGFASASGASYPHPLYPRPTYSFGLRQRNPLI